MPLLGNTNCDSCIEGPSRNNLASAVAGFLFFTAWWVAIDICASGHPKREFDPAYYACGLCGTVALFMVNVVSKAQLRGASLASDGFLYMGPVAAMLWLFVGFFMAFASCIGACWILIANYLTQNSVSKWPGFAVLLQNVLIFASNMIYKFGRTETDF